MAKEDVVRMGKEIDEGSNKKSGWNRILESKPVKRVISLGAAAVTAMTIGLESKAMAETTPSDLQNGTSVTEASDAKQYETLTVGSEGPEVAALKQRMFELGYYKANTVNGSFTANTAEYVKKFETINGLPVDGVADPEMQALFFSDKARKADGSLVVPEPYQPKEILPGSEEERIINARFKSFLEGEGEFSDEELKDKMYYSYLKKVKSDLGFVGATEDGRNLLVQGVFLGHFEFEGENCLAMGVKNKRGDREIIIAQWLIDELKTVYSFIPVFSVNVNKNNYYDLMYKINKYESKMDVISFMDEELLNRVILFYFYNFSQSTLDYDDEKKRVEYFIQYVLPKREINVGIVKSMWDRTNSSLLRLSSGTSILASIEVNPNFRVKEFSDIRNLMINKLNDLPLLSHIGYSIFE